MLPIDDVLIVVLFGVGIGVVVTVELLLLLLYPFYESSIHIKIEPRNLALNEPFKNSPFQHMIHCS